MNRFLAVLAPLAAEAAGFDFVEENWFTETAFLPELYGAVTGAAVPESVVTFCAVRGLVVYEKHF